MKEIYIYEATSINIYAVCSCQSCLFAYHLFFPLPLFSFYASITVVFLFYRNMSLLLFCFLSASFSTFYLDYLFAFISASLSFQSSPSAALLRFSAYCFFTSHSVFCFSCSILSVFLAL